MKMQTKGFVAGISAWCFAALCQAQHPAGFHLPVLPPTAAAAGMAQQQAQLLAAFDTNKNGRLDPAEIQAAQAGLVQPIPGQGGSNPQAAANMAALQRFLLNKFDRNGNGVLDLPEIQAARMAMNMAAANRGPQTGAMNPMNGQNGGNLAPPVQPVKKAKKARKPKPKRLNARAAQFDQNGDGKLDADERQAMEAAQPKPQAKPKKPAKAKTPDAAAPAEE